MSVLDRVKAAIVDVIRGLWDLGLYRQNKTLKRVHDHWFDVWVEWETGLTMLSVDDQVKGLLEEWDWTDDNEPVITLYDSWVHTELNEGETPLGGEMRTRAPWVDQEEP